MEATQTELRSSGSSSEGGTSKSSRRQLDAWFNHGLPPNAALSSLPPLPVTPASTRPLQDPYLSLHRSRPFRELLETATERSKTPAPAGAPTPRTIAKTFEPSYPVLSARQSNSNLARDSKLLARTGARSPLVERRWKSPAKIPLPESPEVSEREWGPADPPVETLALPVSSPQQIVPSKGALPPSPPVSALPPTVQRDATPSPPAASRSGSFRLARDLPDMTNLLDASMGFGRQSLGNETFDLDIAALRVQATPRSGAPVVSTWTQRILPASSSNRSLASVDENEGRQACEQSTLLPSSPVKTQDLLKNMITNESFLDEPSMYLPPPPASTRKTPHRNPVHQADMTMDIQTLMSKVRKPKRASGTEESFVDLLHDEPSMLLADETFLPGSIRRDPRKAKSTPRLSSGSSPKTIAGQLAAYPPTIKATPAGPVTDRQIAHSPAESSPIKTLPERQVAYSSRPTTMTIIRSSPPRNTPRRTQTSATTPSRHAYPVSSPTRTTTLPDRQMAYPTPSRTPRGAVPPGSIIPDRQRAYPSPTKMGFPTPGKRTPPASAGLPNETPRGRTAAVTPRTDTRRISLSAGPVPNQHSARISRIDLPPATPRAARPITSRTPGKTASGLPAKISADIEAAKGHQRARSTGATLASATTSSQPLTNGDLPRPRSSAAPAPARGSAVPPPRAKESTDPRPETAKPRIGSTPATTVIRAATSQSVPQSSATIGVRTTRPGLPGNSAPSARAAAGAPARPAPASTAARMDQIRSKIATTRTFGVDANPKLNGSGLPRAPAATASAAKARGMSTPAASTIRPSLVADSKSSRINGTGPAAGAAAGIPSARASTIPKPASRLPIVGTSKSSLPPPGSSSSAGLASIRERLDRLQARQQAARGAR